MDLAELTANLNFQAELIASQKRVKQEQVKQTIYEPGFEDHLADATVQGEVVEEDAEDEDDDEDEVEVTQEEFDDSLALHQTTLDTYDRLIEDDRINLPESLRMNILARRIDLWDFLTEYLTEESIEKTRDPEQEALKRLSDEL